MPNFLTVEEAAKNITASFAGDDPKAIEQAMIDFCRADSETVKQELMQAFEEYQRTQDERILAERGVRKLTAKETAWYNKVIDVMKSGNPKQVFTEIIGSDDEDDIMPHTIIEDVFRNLTENHPLLSRISTQSVGYLTKWIRNRHTAQMAAWGTITAEIEKEITSSFDVVDVRQNKLSCFAVLERGMADLGPSFLDTYIRTVMYDAMAYALESAIITGTGVSMPIGMDRVTTSGDTVSGYTQKTPISVTDFTPANYGTLLANFAFDEDGKSRTFDRVCLIVNQSDYLTKIMPATTALNSSAVYVNNLFPFPTDVIVSNAVTTGQAIMGILDEYTLFIGQAARNNVIEYTDDYRFLEDQRVFKIVQYADGRAFDNTSFQLLDISTLDPAYILVKNV